MTSIPIHSSPETASGRRIDSGLSPDSPEIAPVTTAPRTERFRAVGAREDDGRVHGRRNGSDSEA